MRHGRVQNPGRVLYGRLPGFVLSPAGREQARLLSMHFLARPIVEVTASPLERAQETAAAIAAPHGLEVGADDRLIEARNDFEGVAGSLPAYILRHPATWWRLRDLRAPSWGERNIDLAARITDAVSAARDRHPGGEVVLVSHQAPIWVGRLAIEGRRLSHNPRRRRCALGSVTTLVFDGDRPVRVTYAEPAAAALRTTIA